jgi:hypothetical protein
LLLAHGYMSSDDEMVLSPSALSDASTMQDMENAADVLKTLETTSSEETHDDIVEMPLSTPKACRRICGRELSIAELKTALGTACGRGMGSQEYSHSKPTASKPPVRPLFLTLLCMFLTLLCSLATLLNELRALRRLSHFTRVVCVNMVIPLVRRSGLLPHGQVCAPLRNSVTASPSYASFGSKSSKRLQNA